MFYFMINKQICLYEEMLNKFINKESKNSVCVIHVIVLKFNIYDNIICFIQCNYFCFKFFYYTTMRLHILI